MTKPSFDSFPRFGELTELLEGWAAAHGDLMEQSSIGRSHQSARSG